MNTYLRSIILSALALALTALVTPHAVADQVIQFAEQVPAGYSKYVEVDVGKARMIILSGQVAIDPQGKVVGKNDLNRQLEYVFASIRDTLGRAGGSMEHLVKINNYFVDLSDVNTFRRVRDKYVNLTAPPASTTMEVRRFVNPDILVEIEATAIIPKP